MQQKSNNLNLFETMVRKMICVRCHAQLEANARFCRNCGLPVAPSQSQHVFVSPPNEQGTDNTVPISSLAEQLNTSSPYQQQPNQQPPYQQQPVRLSAPGFQQSASPVQSPPNFYQAPETNRGGRSAVVNAPRRRSRTGCVLGCLGALLILVLLLGVTWVFALRPYVHNVAMTQMDNAMTNAVNQIPTVGLPIPPGTTLPLSDGTINSILAANVATSDPVQSPNVQIASNQILLAFKLYGQDCTITTIPQMQNGKLVATNVAVTGIVGLVLSPQDITSLLNSHIEDAQARINHRVTNVRLLEHKVDVTLG